MTTRTKRVVRNGAPRNDLVLSAYQAPNEDVFPKILELYVPRGSVVADVT
ncbi:MAG: site-specific DNA-methyltransferase, partial [Dehalococcoidia bacterium]|nr:site-specific DNA-methyltransferase [Dehalococcoidia bacterium]